MSDRYDVIIVGAGLAGLTTAHALSGYKVLLLEKEPTAGGRVRTRTENGVTYELGAIFPYCKEGVPFTFAGSPLLEEHGPVGLWLAGKVHYGNTVVECITSLGHTMLTRAMELVRHGSFRSLTEQAYKVVNGFFRVIHPANMEGYLPQRRLDALMRFDTSHFQNGNGELVAEYLKRIPGPIETGADVIRVCDEGDSVRVVYRHDGCEKQALAGAVVITAPAPVAAGMIAEAAPECRKFLESVRFGGGAVVVIAFKDAAFKDFSYIVTPDAPFNAIIANRSAHGVVVLTAYYIGNNAPEIEGKDSSELVKRTLETLAQMNIGEFTTDNVLFTDAKYWENIGPRITPETYGHWHEGLRRPSGRVVLAGDYVCAGENSLMPYGMTAAIQSGREAAEDLVKLLDEEMPVQKFTPELLTVCSIYRLTDAAPFYVGQTEEGDVAWYGLLLQSDPANHRMRDYLLNCAKDSLWEYQHGFGVTSADSALVLEGLLAAGVNNLLLRESAAALVKTYFSPEEGAFRTVVKGRAAYWEGVSPETTALIAYLLLRIAPDTYAEEIDRCAEYLAATQNPDSTWSGKWFPSLILPTWYAVRFLHAYNAERYRETITRSRNWIVRTCVNGCWSNSIIETSLALLTLRTLKDTALVVERGEAWLRKQQTAAGRHGEQVLYYWFEEGAEKLFYSCRDKGAIASAWARLATGC